MRTIVTLIVALLPAVLLWLYIWKKDRQKEPTPWLVKAMLWGIAICMPVAIFEIGIQSALFGTGDMPSNLFETTAFAFIAAAIPEETLKLFALWVVLRKNPYFDEHFDGIVNDHGGGSPDHF